MNKLSENYQVLFRGMKREGYSTSDIQDISTLMGNNKLIGSVIPAYLKRLQSLTVLPEKTNNRLVIEGWEIARKYFEGQRQTLDAGGVIPVVYGSLQYSNPRNLDFDMVMAGYYDIPSYVGICEGIWAEDLRRQWNGVPEGDIYYNPVERIYRYAKLLSESSSLESVSDLAVDISLSFSSISMVLSGIALLRGSESELSRLRTSYNQLLKIDPVIPAMVANELHRTVSEMRPRN